MGVDFRTLNRFVKYNSYCDGTEERWKYARPEWHTYRTIALNLGKKGKYILSMRAHKIASFLFGKTG